MLRQDKNNDGFTDTIVFTFDEKVYNAEKEDFRIIYDGGKYIVADKVEYAKDPADLDKEEKTKLVVTFSNTVANATTIQVNYSKDNGGTKALSDEIGNEVNAFTVDR